MRVFLVLCILAVSRADLLQDLIKRDAELPSTLISTALRTAVGRRDLDRRNIFDDIKKGLEKVGNAIATATKAAVPVVEEIGKQVLPVAEKVAPSLISAGLTALVGRRDLSVLTGEKIDIFGELKKIVEGILHEDKDADKVLPSGILTGLPVLVPTSKVIETALPALLSGVGKREIERRNLLDIPDTVVKVNCTGLPDNGVSLPLFGLASGVGKREIERRGFLDDLKNTLKTIAQQAVETLAPTVLESALPALLSSVGKRGIVEAGLLGHVKDEMLSVVDKLKESVEGAEKIATNLESNLKAAAQGLTSGQDVKALAQMVLSTLEADVKSMMDKGTFDLDIDSLIKNIVPNAVAKLFPKHSRRFLLDDIVNGLKDSLGDELGLLSGTAFEDLKTFLGNIESAAVHSLSPVLGNLKALAETFLTQAGNATAEVAAEAVKFFQPFQTQLGSVFTQIENVAAKLTGT